MLTQDTSRQAWRDFVPVTAALDRAIMDALSGAGDRGLCCAEIEAVIDRNHQAVSGNLRHLAERGLVEKSGFYGTTSSGRQAIRWKINLLGPETVTSPPARRNRLREAVEKAVRDLEAPQKGIDPLLDRIVADLKKALGR